MNSGLAYKPGHATAVEVRKGTDKWTLVLTRNLRHPPALVWEALTDPDQLREWAPFDVNRNLATTGPVQLSTVGAPTVQTSQTEVTRAEPPHLLEYSWGDNDMRWQLEDYDGGTRLTLWHNIDRNFISMGAAGWHICLDVLDHLLNGDPLGRIVGPEAMKFEWPRLNTEYAAQMGIEAAQWPSKQSKG